MEAVFDWILKYSYLGLFVILMLGIIGAPFPDDLVLAFAGYLISAGYLKPVPTFAAAFIGSLCGITVSYGLGRALGVGVVERYGSFVGLKKDDFGHICRWYNRFGGWLLLVGYFISGVRHFTALVAGVSKLNMLKFAVFAYTGGFLWSVTVISVGRVLGEHWRSICEHRVIQIAVPVAIVVGLILFHSLRGRRCGSVSRVRRGQI